MVGYHCAIQFRFLSLLPVWLPESGAFKENILYGPIFIVTIFTFVIWIFLWTALDSYHSVLGRQMGCHNYKVLYCIHRATMWLCVHNTHMTLLRGKIDVCNYGDQYTIIGNNESPCIMDVKLSQGRNVWRRFYCDFNNGEVIRQSVFHSNHL